MPLAFFLSANSPLKVRKLVQKLTVYRSCAIERSPYFLSFSKQTSVLNIPSLFYCSMHIYNISYYSLLLSGISLFVSIHSITICDLLREKGPTAVKRRFKTQFTAFCRKMLCNIFTSAS